MVTRAKKADKGEALSDEQMDLDENFLEEIREETNMSEEKTMKETCTEVRIPRTAFDPLLPSPQKVAEHNVTHQPFQRWCKICNEARGKEDPHARDQEGIRDGIPEIGADYDHYGDKEDSEKKTLTMVMKDRISGAIFGNVCEKKGAGDEWIVRKMLSPFSKLLIYRSVSK